MKDMNESLITCTGQEGLAAQIVHSGLYTITHTGREELVVVAQIVH